MGSTLRYLVSEFVNSDEYDSDEEALLETIFLIVNKFEGKERALRRKSLINFSAETTRTRYHR